MRVAVHRLRLDRDVVQTGNRYALQEVLDVAVTTLPRVGVRLLVEAKISEVERRPVGPLQFLVLHEAPVEAPALRRRRGPAEPQVDQATRRLEILVEEETRGDERLPDGVEVLAGLLLGKIGREPERVHPPPEQRREGVLVFAVRQTPHHGAAGRPLESAARGSDVIPQKPDDREALLVGGLPLGLRRRHLAQCELVHDVLGVDQRGLGRQRQPEAHELAVTLERLLIVALQAVTPRETGERLAGRGLAGAGPGRRQAQPPA